MLNNLNCHSNVVKASYSNMNNRLKCSCKQMPDYYFKRHLSPTKEAELTKACPLKFSLNVDISGCFHKDG